MSFEVDMSIWDKKIKEINKTIPMIVPKIVKQAHDVLMKDIQSWLSGPYYPKGRGPKTGLVPIPRVSKRLSKSVVTETSSTKETISIISKGSIAPHNIYVHYGTKKMRARRFIEIPVSRNMIDILMMWNREFYQALRRCGLTT